MLVHWSCSSYRRYDLLQSLNAFFKLSVSLHAKLSTSQVFYDSCGDGDVVKGRGASARPRLGVDLQFVNARRNREVHWVVDIRRIRGELKVLECAAVGANGREFKE